MTVRGVNCFRILLYHDPETTVLTWGGPDNLENAINLATRKKWTVIVTGLFVTLIALMNGTVITTAHYAVYEAFAIKESVFPHSYKPVTS